MPLISSMIDVESRSYKVMVKCLLDEINDHLLKFKDSEQITSEIALIKEYIDQVPYLFFAITSRAAFVLLRKDPNLLIQNIDKFFANKDNPSELQEYFSDMYRILSSTDSVEKKIEDLRFLDDDNYLPPQEEGEADV
jgi:hypothetical protein